jgi:uncharacterized membrane protein YkoI
MDDVVQRRSLRFFPLAVVLTTLVSSPAWASDSHDQERARAALEAGQIRPLVEILAGVERRYLGRVIETELDQEDGHWVYEFKLLPSTGRVFKLEVDATTGTVLRSKGPVQERR